MKTRAEPHVPAEKPALRETAKALVELLRTSLQRRSYRDMTADELHRLMQSGDPLTIVDCRAPRDFAEGHLPGALNCSYRTFMDEHEAIPRGGTIVTLCYVGMYSRAAAQTLAHAGHERVFHLVGGMKAWSEAFGDPTED